MRGHFLPWLPGNTGFWGLRKRHPQAQAVINVVMFFIFGRKICIRCETTSLPQAWVCFSNVTHAHHIPFVCINRICVLLLMLAHKSEELEWSHNHFPKTFIYLVYFTWKHWPDSDRVSRWLMRHLQAHASCFNSQSMQLEHWDVCI